MADYWNDSEFAQVDESVDEVVQDLTAETIEESDGEVDDSKLEADVERRLEVATLYKLLLGDTFFKVDSEAARIVTKRLRKFVREELNQLLGISRPQPVAQLPFTDLQVEVLRRVADKVVQRDGAPPVPAPVTAPVQPVQALKPPRVEKPVQGLAKREAPAPKPAPAKTPTAKPATKHPPAAPKRVRNAPAEDKPTLKEITHPDEPNEKKVFRKESTENGRLVHEYINAQGQTISTKDATPQVRPPDAIPMPSQQMLGTIMEQQAVVSVSVAADPIQQALNTK